MLRRTMLAGLASLTLLGGCSSSGGSGSRSQLERDVAGTLARDPEFSILAQLIGRAGYTDRLKRRGPFTLFAPTDKAFGDLRPGQRSRLLSSDDRDLLRAVLDHHIVAERVPLGPGTAAGPGSVVRSVRTIDGEEVEIGGYGRQRRFGTGTVTRADIAASNGLIHAIDQVQFPPQLFQGPGSFSST
jgi:transforming growth factor-beta-induced protein